MFSPTFCYCCPYIIHTQGIDIRRSAFTLRMTFMPHFEFCKLTVKQISEGTVNATHAPSRIPCYVLD